MTRPQRDSSGRQTLPGKRQQAEATGRRAEMLVALRYRLSGYRILARRFTCRGGEIDLVAERRTRDGPLLVFIEVKARRDKDSAILAVSARNRRRIESAGRQFIAHYPAFAEAAIRYDIAAVVGWQVSLLRDAWRG